MRSTWNVRSLQIVNGAAQYVVRFALEFRRRLRRALLRRKRGGVEAVDSGLAAGIFAR